MIDFDLNDCVEGEELNPSAYNPDDYPTKETVLDFIALNSHKKPINIDLKSLSVNGTVKRDSMETYLESKHISSSNLKMLSKPLARSTMTGSEFLKKSKNLVFN